MGAANYGDYLTFFDNRTFAGAQTTNGDWLSSASCGALRRAKQIVFVLDITAAATDVGDTLDVKIQNGLPGSSGNTTPIIANDIVHFTQVLGNGGAKQYVARVRIDAGVAGTGAPGTALAASTVVDGPISDLLRFTLTIVDANANSSFTGSLKAYVKG